MKSAKTKYALTKKLIYLFVISICRASNKEVTIMFWYGRGFAEIETEERISPMEFLIISLLVTGPKNGYQIISELADRFKRVWVPKSGTIYPALSRLVAKGIIEGFTLEKEKESRFYKLTEKGKRILSKMVPVVEKESLFADIFTSLINRSVSQVADKSYLSKRVVLLLDRIKKYNDEILSFAERYAMTFHDYTLYEMLIKTYDDLKKKAVEKKEKMENELKEKEKKMFKIKIE